MTLLRLTALALLATACGPTDQAGKNNDNNPIAGSDDPSDPGTGDPQDPGSDDTENPSTDDPATDDSTDIPVCEFMPVQVMHTDGGIEDRMWYNVGGMETPEIIWGIRWTLLETDGTTFAGALYEGDNEQDDTVSWDSSMSSGDLVHDPDSEFDQTLACACASQLGIDGVGTCDAILAIGLEGCRGKLWDDTNPDSGYMLPEDAVATITYTTRVSCP